MPHENVEETIRRKKGPPLAQSYCNPQIAKNLAVENLKHHPLPDTVEDAIYRSLQMKKERHPGKSLDVLPRAAAVGCKSYGTPGPTQCSKLKVYRPKTAGVLPRKDLGQNLELLTRPKTSSGFDQQTRKDKKLSQMQLALCWDLKPAHPGDEPKRSPHIDGSNGSKAPAVFALVQPPQEELPPASPSPQNACSPTNEGRKSKKHQSKPRDAWGTTSPPALERDIHRGRYGVTNPSAVMDIINTNTTQSGNVVGPRDTAHLHEHRSGSGRQHNNGVEHNECNSVNKNLNNCRKGSGSKKDSHNSSMSSGFDSVKLSRRKHCHSSPNLTNVGLNDNDNNVNNDMNNNDNGCGRNGRNKLLNNRPCMACDTSCSANCHKSSKPEYKMAFKAGKPDNNFHKQSNGSIKNNGSNSSGHSLSSLRSNGYQAPKPKVPYAKRSYSIGTLAPPFSLWPGTTGQDYPEHWRLASVYQHSYKPMGSRRKTFLQSVYQ